MESLTKTDADKVPTSDKVIWEIDPIHSKIEFSVSHMMISQVTGYFRKFEGKAFTEGEEFEHAECAITINASSIETNNEQRNKHLMSDDFLHTVEFPEILFKSNKVKRVDNNHYLVSGILTIRNISNEIELSVQYNGTIKDPHNNRRAGFKATGQFNRKDFGVNWTGMLETGGLIAGNKIDVTAFLELVHQ